MLSIDALSAKYGGREALRNVTVNADGRTVCGLIGHNGAGKSTLLKTVIGLVRPNAGSIRFNKCDIGELSVPDRLARGIALVPQGNRVFDRLTVRENLLVNAMGRDQRVRIVSGACDQFPSLGDILRRPAGVLSGGERQTLALAMAMSGAPRLLLLDEPSSGLDPRAVDLAFDRITRLRTDSDITIVIAEQNVAALLAVADVIYALRAGEVVFQGPPLALRAPDQLRAVFL
jgi:ABC-type branched-subunit amino acid transport system ATPase component